MTTLKQWLGARPTPRLNPRACRRGLPLAGIYRPYSLDMEAYR